MSCTGRVVRGRSGVGVGPHELHVGLNHLPHQLLRPDKTGWRWGGASATSQVTASSGVEARAPPVQRPHRAGPPAPRPRIPRGRDTYVKRHPRLPVQLLPRFGAISLQKVLGRGEAGVGRVAAVAPLSPARPSAPGPLLPAGQEGRGDSGAGRGRSAPREPGDRDGDLSPAASAAHSCPVCTASRLGFQFLSFFFSFFKQ